MCRIISLLHVSRRATRHTIRRVGSRWLQGGLGGGADAGSDMFGQVGGTLGNLRKVRAVVLVRELRRVGIHET